VEDVLLNRCSNATERLLAYSETVEPKSQPCALRKKGVAAAKEAAGGATWRDLPVAERITHALVKGLDTYIVAVWSSVNCVIRRGNKGSGCRWCARGHMRGQALRRGLPVSERIREALVKGLDTYIVAVWSSVHCAICWGDELYGQHLLG
jgi:cobalamin-dependent methionine synthase I